MLATALILIAIAIGYMVGLRQSSQKLASSEANWHSRPGHHASYVALVATLPGLCLWILWSLFGGYAADSIVASSTPADIVQEGPAAVGFFMDDVRRVADGQQSLRGEDPAVIELAATYSNIHFIGSLLTFIGAFVLFAFGLRMALSHLSAEFRARNHVEKSVEWLLIAAATVSILTTIGIIFSVLFESIRFFQQVPVTEFLFGTKWSPQIALRADQVGSSGAFGAVPLFAGTGLITLIAICVSGPIGLLSAIYLSEYASPRFRSIVKPLMEILAGVPTVVYGFFAALTIAPAIRGMGESIGLSVSSESALAAGIVMGVMIIPFISSLSDDAINAVPQAMRDASLGLGATRSETVQRVIIPAALPGIIAGFLLALSRAIGETMIVVMAAGLAANLTANPLEAVTTVTVQIVTLLVGDQEFDSAKTLAAFALGLVLFVGTLILNIIALYVLKRYREIYD